MNGCLLGVLVIVGILAPSQGFSYSAGQNTYFHPSDSSTFSLVKLGNVNVTFLDETNLLGYDGADFVEIGGYSVKTRFGLIQQCNSANFDTVDGILGFGWANNTRTAALLKTLTTHGRPHWNITQPEDFVPMPRIFSFMASHDAGELQLGGYDPDCVTGEIDEFPMVGMAYGVNITSITFNGVELLHFANENGLPQVPPTTTPYTGPIKPGYVGEFDSGTTCLLLPNSTVNGTFTRAPYQILFENEMKGIKAPLIYTIGGKQYEMPYHECVDAADTAMILGDAWFRKFAIIHNLLDLDNKKMGLAKLKPSYVVGSCTNPSNALAVPGGATTVLSSQPRRSKLAMSRSLMVSSTHPVNTVRKVPLTTHQHVTYNIKLSIGTPEQALNVIFDTGSYMLAVFADAPPNGMIPTGLLQTAVSSVPSWDDLSSSGATGAMLVVANLVLVVGLVAAGLRLRHQGSLRAPPHQHYGSIPLQV